MKKSDYNYRGEFKWINYPPGTAPNAGYYHASLYPWKWHDFWRIKFWTQPYRVVVHKDNP